ncbi:hypothetical protein K469DRAFT_732066 [Zopfia rhizophila CBS 207.26]|uniref:C6 transcription factor RegA n=1 Tax=Zopfia rhizophila CBS 207.26 TaxID=1314779 RepID=A0A6A6EMM7_9PEZI|nr:hypothetical protein K469DRAFT_732066 [Zopfia rhizophila CBS 207.26]
METETEKELAIVPSLSTPHSDSDQKQRLFQCSTCKRAFTRGDHLTRHVRSHTRQKPYVCPTCTKCFSRADLLKRHAAGHESDRQCSNKRRKPATVRVNRVIQACEACAQNHLRCEDVKPCSRCWKKGIACRVPASTGSDEIDAMRAAEDLLELSMNVDDSAVSNIVVGQPGLTGPDVRAGVVHDSTTTPSTINGLDGSNHNSLQQPTQNDQSMPELTLGTSLSSPDPCLSGIRTPRGVMDFSFDWNVELNDLDLGFLDQYNTQIPFNAETPSTDITLSPEQHRSSQTPHHGVAVRAEAFRRSVWRYLPQSSLHFGAAEESNLALPEAERGNSHSHPEHRINSHRRAIQEYLSQVTRDKILAFVLGTCNAANVPRIVSAFPSVELLDSLLQYFLTSRSHGAKHWLHFPTFSPSRVRPALLAVIIAAGAVLTPDTPLRKLGFALQEASRLSLANTFEEDNSVIRDLQMLQCMELQLEIGMWSGISRKMEISESFLQPLVTMLRRGGRFRHSTYPQFFPGKDDEGEALENKWRQWVHEESYLRLVYRVFEHDRQSSMALLKLPLISYSEMQLPLPASEDLWRATSAETWKALCLSEFDGMVKRPSLTDCINDLEYLNQHEVASIAFLFMIWGMVWESSIHANNSLIMSSRHQELTRLLEDFRVTSHVFAQGSNCNIEIVLELMLMHLHVSLEDMQLFAGLEGQEEARRVFPDLKDWVTAPQARQALWHAGQVLRSVRKLSKGLVRDFNAIAVYHAGLVFWVYGFLKNSVIGSSTASTSEFSQFVCLEDTDTIDVRRFITLDRGTPVFQGSNAQQPFVQISDTSSTMDALVHILKGSHDIADGADGSCPPLVENLVQLMEGLRTAAKQ